jgi:outer membrane immunogenic protein
MRKLSLACVGAAVLAAGPALAADLPVVVAAPTWSWTGFYIGGNGGYSWGGTDTGGTASLGLFVNGVPFTGFPLRTPQPGFAATSVNGWLGGGQAGFNWQTGALVLGAEADIQASGQQGSNTFCTNGLIGPCPTLTTPVAPGTAPFTLTVDQQLAWFGTGRGRIGAGGDHFLFYLTGGAAFGEIKSDYRSAGTLFFAPPAVTGTTSVTRVGWVVGGGVEAHITDNLTAKLEYLYMDLGSFTDTLIASGSQAGATATVTTAFASRFTDNIVRVGLNYKFGWPTPVVAKY